MHPDLPRLLQLFYNTAWAVRPDFLVTMQTVLDRWATGVKLSPADIQAAVGTAPADAQQRRQSRGPGAIGVLPIYGLISHRAHVVQNISGPGGTSTELVSRELRRLMADDAVGAIVLDIDSPGGNVHGVQELADEIHSYRGKKKIVAHANATSASGAYWLAAACDEIIVTPSGEVGSVGVFCAHEDKSEFLKSQGRTISYVQAGKYKTEGNSAGPLDEEARAYLQAMVDEMYGVFTKSLAKFRDIDVATVRSTYGEGRMVMAAEALKRGMVDRIETFDDTLARLARTTQAQKPRARGTRAERLRLAETG